MLGGFYLVFTAAQAVTAAVGVLLMRERLSHLLMVPAYRLIFEPLRAYLLYKAGYLAVRGVPVGWNKLTRTGALNRPAGPENPAGPTDPAGPQGPVSRPPRIPRQPVATERGGESGTGLPSDGSTTSEPAR